MDHKILLTQEELIVFCKEMHLILSSSISVVDGFESIIDGIENKETREALNRSLKALEDNQQISEALEESGLFSPYMISMIEVGEKTGKTDQVMASLAEYYEKNLRIKKQIRTGTVYPLIVAGMVTIVIGVMVTRVLPIFNEVFRNLGGNVPSSVDFVTGAGRVIVGVILLSFIALVTFVVFLLFLSRSSNGRTKARKILDRLPGIRDIRLKYQTAQFANSLSLLVSSGYDLHESLKMTGNITEDHSFRQKIERALDQLDEGKPLYQVLGEMEIFGGVHAQMVKLSVQTGRLDSVLGELSEKYTQDVDDSIATLMGIIEPSLVGATSFIIGGILLTVMLPLLGIMSSMG